MRKTKLSNRFFQTSRGRIVMLLRGLPKTVNDLAANMELTDNAVRAHLLSLERDGLVKQSGIQRGTRKPHFAYELTDEGEQLFPKAYDAVVNHLIGALKGRISPKALEEVMREAGRSLAKAQSSQKKDKLSKRLDDAVIAMESIGGAVRVENEKKEVLITSQRCPLSAAVAEHPEVCKLAETLLAEIIGSKVKEECDREATPRCRFHVLDVGRLA
jgi:predicted ArsR family transcriptional regulator